MHETEAKWNLEKCYGALRPSIGMIKLKFPKKKKKKLVKFIESTNRNK